MAPVESKRPILLITNDLGPHLGGIETFLLGLLGELKGEEIIIYTSKQSGSEDFDLVLAKKMGVKSQTAYLLVLLGTTALISGSFWAYFSSGPMTSSFFSQWFHRAGFKAVIYDLTLLTLMYLVYVGIMKLF